MGKLAIALVVALLASGAASASDKTDVMAVFHKWVDAFNQGDATGGAGFCADSAVVIDDIAPHVWQGPGACAAWYKAYTDFAAKAEMTGASVKLGKAQHLEVDGGVAYVVAPSTLTYSKAGAPTTEKGLVTMTFKKSDKAWQITGWAWADQ